MTTRYAQPGGLTSADGEVTFEDPLPAGKPAPRRGFIAW
jgi:hypothetical protein